MVLLYEFSRLDPTNTVYLRGKCFGSMLSNKLVLTSASCVLDKNAMKKGERILKENVFETRIALVISLLLEIITK